MWYLQGFDRRTEELVKENRLSSVDTATIRRLLKIDDDLPIEPFGFDIPTTELAREFAAFSDTPVVVNPELWYQLGFYAD
jgi:hypothetical protein